MEEHTNLWSASCWVLCMFLPASCTMILRLLHVIRIGLCVLTYHVHKNYLMYMYIVAMWPYFSLLYQFRRELCVTTVSSVAQLQVWDRYWEAEATQTQQCKANWKRKCQKRAATHGAFTVTNRQTVAARRAFEWLRTFEGLAGFEI